VLSAGLIAFLVAYLGSSDDTKESFGPGKAQTFGAQRDVALPPEARDVAARFVRTAVLRRNLDQAWAMSTPNARGGLTHKEWLMGDIPIVSLSAPLDTGAITKIVYSHPRDAEINIVLVPQTPNANGIKTTLYVVDLKKVGSRWLIDYCQPQSTARLPTPS
jgi:hypothetical protein